MWNEINYAECNHALIILIGAYRRKGTTDVQQTFKLTSLHIHEDFSMRHLKNDIALLQLDRPVKLSDKVSTVCLPSQAPDLKANCYITGKFHK